MHTSDKLSQRRYRIARHLLLVAIACSVVAFTSACNSEGDNGRDDILPGDTVPEQVDSDQTGDPDQTDADQDGNEADNHSNNLLPHTVRFTDSDENLWPPQPIDITNVQTVGDQPAPINQTTGQTTNQAATQVRESAAAQVNANSIFDNSIVVQAIGERYAVLANYQVTDKAGNNHTEIEIFNYSDNLVVTVNVGSDGSITTKTAAAFEYQPAESQAEVQHAISLARKALIANGYLDQERLIGTGLLAHPTAAEVARSKKQFYSQRKVYVTFGVGGGAVPDYRALVNLSTEVVEQSGPIQ